MTESASQLLLFGLSLALPVGLFGLRQSASRLGSNLGDRLHAILSPGNVAAISGSSIGLSVFPAVAGVIDDSASFLMLFVSVWCGFTVGCGIDLRALRKTSSILLASQLGQCIVAMLAIPLLTYLLKYLPWAQESVLFSPGALLITACMCLSEGVVGSPERDHRQRVGGIGRAFPKPSIAAFVAILLASLGGGQDPMGSTHVAALSFLSGPSFTWSISGIGELILAGLFMGCGAGLLSDLAAKDHSSTGMTFCVFSGVLLLVSGISVVFGVQPLMIGVMAGVWLINATLRRLDVHHVIDRSRGLSSVGVPFLLGWILGFGIATRGISGEGFLAGLCLILAIRPIVRIAGWRLGEYLIKAKNPQALSREGESLLFDNSGFLIAVVLVTVISGPVGVGFLAAALVSQLVFAAISRWSPSMTAVDASLAR